MINSNKEKHAKNNFLNSVAMGLTGAVVGLGIAAAGLVLRKEKNREMIKESLSDVKDQVIELIDDKGKDVKNTVNKVEQDHDKTKEKLKKIVEVSKES